MKNHRFSFLAVIIATIFLSTGCKGRSVRANPSDGYNTSGAQSAPTDFGPSPEVPSEMGPPLPPGQQPSTSENVGPVPAPDFTPPQDGYVLVLGPGLARGLAYLGVLKEMEERQLPIRGIVGVEIGAVIGGIWASSNMNNLEWEMHKFGRETLLDFPLLGLRAKQAEGKKLIAFLDEAIKINLLQKMKVPLLVASSIRNSPGSESLLIEGAGSAKEILRGAMSLPGLVKPFVWEEKERLSAGVESPFPVARAKALGIGKTVCVDVVGKGDNFTPKDRTEESLAVLMHSISVIARQQLKECDVVLSIPVDGVSYLNFEDKADLRYRGKVAVQKWLEQEAHSEQSK